MLNEKTCKHNHNHHCKKEKNKSRDWSKVSYAGETLTPDAEEPNASSWPLYYFKKTKHNTYEDKYGKPINFKIRVPDHTFDFEGEQLRMVKKAKKNLTDRKKKIAKYWGDGPATKQWTPIIDILIDTYGISAPRAARILATTNSAFNDAFIIAWDYKFKWKVLRPNQIDQHFKSLLCMPRHPSYPSGHATIAGCAEVVLGYYFKPEKDKLKGLAEECAKSRLYAGVHFPIDNDEGLELGRDIGRMIVKELKKHTSDCNTIIDYEIKEYKDAKLIPPPYKQAIPYDRDTTCKSSTIEYKPCNHYGDCNKLF